MTVELSKRFRKILRESLRGVEVSAALTLAPEGFESPSAHSRLAIRKLSESLYECRTRLGWRLIFEARNGVMTFDFAGDHDEVQKYLRRRR